MKNLITSNLAVLGLALIGLGCSKNNSQTKQTTVELPGISVETIEVLKAADASFYLNCDSFEKRLVKSINDIQENVETKEKSLVFDATIEHKEDQKCTLDAWGKKQPEGEIIFTHEAVKSSAEDVPKDHILYLGSEKGAVVHGENDEANIKLKVYEVYTRKGEETAAQIANTDEQEISIDVSVSEVDPDADKSETKPKEKDDFFVGKGFAPEDAVAKITGKLWITDDCQAIVFKGEKGSLEYGYKNLREKSSMPIPDCTEETVESIEKKIDGGYKPARILYGIDDQGEELRNSLTDREFVIEFTHADGSLTYSRIEMPLGSDVLVKYGTDNPNKSDLIEITEDPKRFTKLPPL